MYASEAKARSCDFVSIYLMLDNCKLVRSSTVNYVGFVFDESILWKDHVDFIL